MPSRRAVLRRFGTSVVAIALATVLAAGPAASTVLAKKGVKPPKTMLPLVVDEVIFDVETGQLMALARIGNNPVELPLNLGTRPNVLDADCPILDLEIGAIDLTLLGLNVTTSDICLAIIAHEGEGLLGDLLCLVANLLDGGLLNLGQILDLLSDDELEAVLDGLRDLLNEVFGLATSAEAVSAAACDILNLSLGPVNLNLLGLEVNLDDCDGGPVTIDITAIPGGGLLGDLLCGLANLLNGGIGGNALKTALNDVANAINDLVT